MTQITEIVPWAVAAAAAAFLVVAAAALTSGRRGGELRGIATSWSFAESWASNVTVGATVLMTVLASTDVVPVMVSDDVPEVQVSTALSIVLVASALSIALVGLAPLVLKAFVSKDGFFHAGGLAAASFLTLTGVGIEVGVISANADRLLGGGEPYIVIGGLVVAGVLLIYAFRSLHELFSKVDSKPEEQSETLKAAQIVADAILKANGQQEVFGMQAVATSVRRPGRAAAIL